MKTKIFYEKSLFKGHTELCESIFCAPFEESSKFEEQIWENYRFKKLIEVGNEYIIFSDIKDCDFVILPYKWDDRSYNTQYIIEKSLKYNKKIIALHNDDFEPKNLLNKQEGYMFTTAVRSSTKSENCFAFPAFTGDFFSKEYEYCNNRIFGFCGAITHGLRIDVLTKLQNMKNISKNFIIRKGFWAPELPKENARFEYLENMRNSTFILCIRGAGNFSYRLYETMMMGRIPIILDSDQVFPFEKYLDYEEFSFRIKDSEISKIEYILQSILETISDDDIVSMQKKSRYVWEEYMSPHGWIKNFTKELC